MTDVRVAADRAGLRQSAMRRAGLSTLVALGGAAFLSTAPAAPVRANTIEDGKAIVQSMSVAVITVLRRRTSRHVQEATLRTVFARYFDVPRIARFVLGRSAWASASSGERSQFLALFQRYIAKVYAAQLRQYSGEIFQVVGASPERNGVVVTSRIVNPRGTQPFFIKWRMRPSGGQLKVRDVVIENISMSLNQRREFASVYRRRGNNMAGLLQAMREKMAELDRR